MKNFTGNFCIIVFKNFSTFATFTIDKHVCKQNEKSSKWIQNVS